MATINGKEWARTGQYANTRANGMHHAGAVAAAEFQRAAMHHAANDQFAAIQGGGVQLDQHLTRTGHRPVHLTQFHAALAFADVHPIRFHEGPHSPLKTGLRFSMKALRPSA